MNIDRIARRRDQGTHRAISPRVPPWAGPGCRWPSYRIPGGWLSWHIGDAVGRLEFMAIDVQLGERFDAATPASARGETHG